MNIVFFGTPEFSLPALQAIAKDPRFTIALVVSQPAKPVGRDQVLTDSPVAAFAKEQQLPLATPETLRKNVAFVEELRAMKPDFLLVVAYGKIIPNELLSVARFGAVNIHPSALPKYRGASPLQMSIANGETDTAVSIMMMDEEVDHGPILKSIPARILDTDTTTTLGMRLFTEAAAVLGDTLAAFAEGKREPKAQKHDQATFTNLIDRADGKLRFDVSAKSIDAKRRGFTPWPGVFIELGDGVVVKILDSQPVAACKGFVPGALHDHAGELHVATVDGCLHAKTIQPAGKSPMSGTAFINGYAKYLSR